MDGLDFARSPLIVFWESTRACMLVCKHCRANAITEPLPGELSTEEALNLVDQIASMGPPRPILIVTGGDPLMRRDIWDIVEYAVSRGLRVAMAPSVTPLLNRDSIRRMARVGVSRISISIDSARPEVHDAIRGVPGTFKASVKAVKTAIDEGLKVQVNTVVMRPTVEDLPLMVKLLVDLGVDVWEVFYVIPVGRAARSLDLSPGEWEDVSNFLYDASRYGVLVRTVEGPMFRRVALTRMALERLGRGFEVLPSRLRPGSLYRRLVDSLERIMGPPRGPPRPHTTGTRDGWGVIFVSYNGDVYPSGFLPLKMGNVRETPLADIYRRGRYAEQLRRAVFKGRCGVCEFKVICGGSRARAYSYTGDPLAEDPACQYIPGELGELSPSILRLAASKRFL